VAAACADQAGISARDGRGGGHRHQLHRSGQGRAWRRSLGVFRGAADAQKGRRCLFESRGVGHPRPGAFHLTGADANEWGGKPLAGKEIIPGGPDPRSWRAALHPRTKRKPRLQPSWRFQGPGAPGQQSIQCGWPGFAALSDQGSARPPSSVSGFGSGTGGG